MWCSPMGLCEDVSCDGPLQRKIERTMAFVLTVRPESGHFDLFIEGSTLSVLAPIGYDDEEDVNFFLSVALEPLAGGGHEYVFNVVRVDGTNNDQEFIWDARRTGFIQRDNRKIILDFLLKITRGMIVHLQPKLIFMCTIHANPPAKALEKYTAINNVFRECGYTVTAGEIYHGQHSWWAERS